MRRYLIFILLLPLSLLSQNCVTNYNVYNADSIVYCLTNSSCHTSCDGEIIITVYGLNQPYYFEWGSNSVSIANDNNRDSLCSGNYSVTITDNNGNFVDYRSNQIDEPSELGIFKTLSNPTCFGDSDGFIDITTLGDNPFSWSWNNGFNTEDLNGLTSGQYILTTTDSNNCSRIDTFNLSQPTEVQSITSVDTLSCLSICDASAFVVPTNGIYPFTFLWDNGQSNDTALNLCYGTHSVVITDSTGCTNTNTVFVENPDTLRLNSIIIDSSCYEICDGEIEVTIIGGTGPYDIFWTLNGNIIDSNTTSIQNLCPDTYDIVYVDQNNCLESESIVLFERDSFVIAKTIINDSCYNSCSGQIEVQILNPQNPPFNYYWSNGSNSSIVSNLCADTISLELIDSRLCRDTFKFIITEPLPIKIDSFLVINNNCYNDGNGSILVNLTGGTGNLVYNWSGPNGFLSTNEDISNLYEGSYSLLVRDDYQCSKDTFFTILEPDSLFANSSVQDVSCYSYSNGAINVNIFGGTFPYSISWDAVISDSTYIDSLISSIYVYYIIDSNGCLFSDSVLVDEPSELVLYDSVVNVLCKGYHTGLIDLEVSGGTSPYTYLWSNLITSQDIENIPSGNYSVVITDFNNCQLSNNFIVSEPQFPITTNILGTNILCNGDATGSANLTVSGGVSPYNFQWSNSETSEDINGLTAGNYFVTVVDSNGCDTTNTIEIIENSEIVSTYISSTFTKCYGDSTGELNIINTSGGVPPYNYYCSNGFSSNNVTTILVTSGQYTVIVSDDNNCEETLFFNVQDSPELISSISNTNIDCFGLNNGSIDFNPSGGTLDYNIIWSNNETSEDIYNLSAGTYTVELTDANGCVIYDTATISEPQELIISSFNIVNSVCNGESSGSIDITVDGGTPNYFYDWSNLESSQDLNNISAGLYTVIITDAKNCDISKNFNISEPLPFVEIFNTNDVNCNGESTGSIELILSGNTPPYIYSWDNGNSSSNIDNLEAGLYTVTVQDLNNCTETFSVEIFEPDELTIDYVITDATCEENNDGSITSIVSGGTMPYEYFWSNGTNDSEINNLSKGTYSLEVRDAKSCIYPSETFEINFDGYDGCIEIPSGFTPNNDGIHDEWAIYGLQNFPDVVVHVHNRWGQKIFFSEGYTVPWDGKNNGIDLPIATYYYVIELKESNKIFNGTVTIKR